MTKKKKEAKKDTLPRKIEVIPLKEEKVLFSWRAVARPFQRRDREFWTTVLAILALVSLILFFVKEWFLIAVFLALTFLYYVLTTVEPEKVDYRITTRGVYLPGGEMRVDWDWFRSFWFSSRWGHRLLNLETYFGFPRLVSLVIDPSKEKELRRLLSRFLPEKKKKPDFVERFSRWLVRQLPLNQEKKETPRK